MTRAFWNRWLVCGLAALPAGGGTSPAAAQSAPVREAATRAVEQESGDFLIRVAEDATSAVELTESLPRSDYWIGIAIGTLPDVAKQQLKLEHGLVVAEVMEGSPAEKAEFKAHDILIRAGETKLQAAGDLIKAVDAAKDKELAIVVLREGQERTIKVAPIKRPKSEGGGESGVLEVHAAGPDMRVEIKKLEEALNKLLKEKTGDSPLGIVLARPAVVPQVKVFYGPEFPKNLSISIIKKSGEPAKIHVEKDGKEWDVTEEKIGELPEDIRVHVQQFFVNPRMFQLPLAAPKGASESGSRRIYQYQYAPGATAPSAPAASRATARAAVVPVSPAPAYRAITVPPTPAAQPIPVPQTTRTHTYRIETVGGGVEGKLDAILKKLDRLESHSVDQLEKDVKQLRKELDELRGKSPGERND